MQNILTGAICKAQDPAEKLHDGIAQISEGLKLVAEAALEMVTPFMEVFRHIAKVEYEKEAAISWARSARPTWHAVYHRTKKKRTRKKYLDRIIREYRRNLEDGILEV